MLVKTAATRFVPINMLIDPLVADRLSAVQRQLSANLFGTQLLFEIRLDLHPALGRYSRFCFFFSPLKRLSHRKLRPITTLRNVASHLARYRRFVDSDVRRDLYQVKPGFQQRINLVSLFKGKLFVLFHGNSLMSPSKSEDAASAYPLIATLRVALTS